LIIAKYTIINDFQLFCNLAGGADSDLRRLHKERFEYSKARATAATAVNIPMSAPTIKTSVPAVTLNRAFIIIFAYTTSATFNLFVKTAIPNSTEAKCFNYEKVSHFAWDYTLSRKLEMKKIENDVYTLSKEETEEEQGKDLA